MVDIVDVMNIEDLQGAHHFEGVGIILQDTRPMVEGQGGRGPGHFLTLLAQKGGTFVVLGDTFQFLASSVEGRLGKHGNPILVNVML